MRQLLPLALALALLAPAAGAVQDDPPRALPGLEAALDAMVADGAAVGVVSIVERGGERLLAHASGEQRRGGEAMALGSIFRIYSMSKPVTAVAALTLLDEGLYELDDPVAEHLPELADLVVVDQDDPDETVPLTRPLRVRDLLQHTAGWSYETPWRAEAARNGALDPDLDDMVAALGELPLLFQPGSEWRYGISNDVLGAFAQRVAGQPLDELMHERVFAPLGMVDTGFEVPEDQRHRVAAIHSKGRDGLEESDDWYVLHPHKPQALLEGGAGLFSTAEDYVRFQRMLLNGGELDGARVLREETVALMTRDQIGDVPRDPTLLSRDWGLGIAITTNGLDNGSTGSWTWGGAAGTTMWVDPHTDTVAVFLVQNWFDFAPAIRFGIAAGGALASAPAAPAPAVPDPPAEGPSVLFYLIDTCRADRTSVHGHARETTPFLDALAERSVVFERCYSQAPWTKPSMASILTSRYPGEVAIHSLMQRLPESALTFPEVLQEAGWHTAGFSANPLMGAFSNYTQGFDHFTESITVNRADPISYASGSAAKLNGKVDEWLRSAPDRPTLLYVHSVDPHEEYEPAPEFLARFADPAGMERYREQWKALLATRPNVPGNHLTQGNFDAAGIEPAWFLAHGQDLYDADVLANDVSIEALWDRLMAAGWSEDTIVVVTSDHGEEFFEHGGTSHGYSLFDELIHVPLLIHAPGRLPEGVRVDRPVRSIDLYPTLLDLLDVEAPAGLRGRSLVPLARGAEDWEDAPVYAEVAEDPLGRMAGSGMGTSSVLIDGGWKLHVNYVVASGRERDPRELYDLGADPGETVNLAAAHADRVARMEERIEHWAAANLGLRLSPDEVDVDALDPALVAELEALGYLAGGDDDLPRIGDALPPLARAVLEADDAWTLVTLDPGQRPAAAGARTLHGWAILGSTEVDDDERDEIQRLLYRGFELSDGSMARCFSPRHAVKAAHQGHRVELVICFECLQVQVMLDDARLRTSPISAEVEPAVSDRFRAEGLSIAGDDG